MGRHGLHRRGAAAARFSSTARLSNALVHKGSPAPGAVRRTAGDHRRHDRSALRHPRPVPPRPAAAARRGGRHHPRSSRPTPGPRCGGWPVGAAGPGRCRRGRASWPRSRRRAGRGVHVVAWGAVPDELFRVAPWRWAARASPSCRARRRWLVEALTDLGDPQRTAGTVIGVTGGSGGAGRDDLRLRARAARRAAGARRRRRRRPARSRGRPGARPRGPRRGPLGRALPDHRPAQRPVAARGAAAARGARRR